MVLLLGFVKPEGYKRNSKDARRVDRKIVEAQKYYELYRLDNQKFKTSKIINSIMFGDK